MEEKNSHHHEPTKWEQYAKGKIPSMKRRCSMHNYRDRGIYMVTMVIEGRRPLLGTLAGDPAVHEGPQKPHVVLSAFGEKVRDCWESIPQHYPLVEVMRLCIMPDHIHGLLFVHEKMEKHLGDVVKGFKAGTHAAARELGVITATMLQPTRQNRTNSKGASTQVRYAATSLQLSTAVPPSPYTAAARAHGSLWETGYNDRILTGKGQLQRMFDYMDDNPRRLLVKRLHPEYFTLLGTMTVAGLPMQAMGNRFLLDNPSKIQVQCSRHLYPNEIEQRKTYIIDQAIDTGAVVVSPCISPGEQAIATTAMNEKIPLIVLLLKGFPPVFKPQPRYLQACEEGLLLMLAPYPYQNEKIVDMRQRCLRLNAIASQICANTTH
ncbi:MAG: transposase [Prevotella sp.]|nr:transposase [Prevotella sp.]